MEERELIRLAQGGDRQALDALIRLHYRDISRFLARKTASAAAAEDLTQTVFLRFVQHLGSYTDRGLLRHYLLRLAVNTGNDYFRERKPSPPLEADETLPSLACIHREAEQRELIRQARALLAELPSAQRDVILLHVYHGLKFREIAGIVGCPSSTVKSRYRQGLQKIKISLKERGFDHYDES